MKRFIAGTAIIISIFALGAAAQTAGREKFAQGIKRAAGGRFEAALVDFRAALALAASDGAGDGFLAKIHFNIGVCLYRTDRSAEAVEEFERAVRLAGGRYERAFYALGMAQTDLRDWRAAEAAFLAAARLKPDNGETWLDLGFVYLAERNYEAARGAFARAVAHRSVDASLAHNNLGVIYALSGDLPRAVAEFEAAVIKSGGRLSVAGRNLEFCRARGRTGDRELLAKLEFSN